MLTAILTAVSICLISVAPDTLDVATVSACSQAETASSSPVQRLTNNELRRSGTAFLNEAVRTLSGVSIKDYGGIGGLKTVSVRNFGASHTVISYDGTTISNAQNGQVDISRFFIEDVDEIQISIGQNDNIFQSARSMAGSGTLHIRSKAPSFKEGRSINCTAGITVGSFGTICPKIRYEQKLGDRWSFRANGSWLRSKGNYPYTIENGEIFTRESRLNSDVNIINGEVNIYGKPLDTTGQITTKVNIHSSERGLPGPVVLYTQNPTERLWDRSILISSRYEDQFTEHLKFGTSLSYSNTWNRYTDSSPLYATPQDNRYMQQEMELAARILYNPLSSIRISLAEDLFGNMLNTNIPESPYPRRLSSLTALSAQYLGKSLKATVSLMGTYICETARTEADAAPDRFHISPSASISYGLMNNHLRIRASYKDSYRVPTFNDLYYARVGNTALVPEKARQFNAGMTWSSSHDNCINIGFTADGYINQIKDKIAAIPTMFIWKMHNVGKVRMMGADISMTLRWDASEHMSLHMRSNWSYQYAVDITDPDSKNWKHQIPYTPRHTGNAIISAQTRWFTATYSLNAVGRRYSMGQNIPANLIRGYCDHGISLNHTFTIKDIGLHVSMEALNLTDKNYEVIRYYPMPGRRYRLTIKLSY